MRSICKLGVFPPLASFVFLMLIGPPASAAITVVQHKSATSTANATTVAVTVTSTASSRLLVVGTSNHGTRTVSSVADNASGGSNTYVQSTSAHATANSSVDQVDVWYVLSAAHASATTVTVTFSGSAGTFLKDAEVWEVSGFTTAAFDTSNVVNDTTQTTQTDTGASVTTTSTTGFVVGIVKAAAGDTITQNPKTGNEFTSGGDIPSVATGAVSLISSTAAAHQPLWFENNSFTNYCAATVAFKEAAAGGCTRSLTLLGVGRC